jgi:hypothetical protein
MKPWEVLKALDEGKVVQFESPIGKRWVTAPPEFISSKLWSIYDIAERKWRIKPEPLRLSILLHKDGTILNSTKVISSQHPLEKWEALGWKLIEVVEDVK